MGEEPWPWAYHMAKKISEHMVSTCRQIPEGQGEGLSYTCSNPHPQIYQSDNALLLNCWREFGGVERSQDWSSNGALSTWKKCWMRDIMHPPIRLLEQMSFNFLARLLSKKVKALYTFSKHYSEDCLLYLTALGINTFFDFCHSNECQIFHFYLICICLTARKMQHLFHILLVFTVVWTAYLNA